MLGRLGLMLLTALDIRYKTYMNEKAVFLSNFNGYLSDSFKERLAFNITDSSAYLRDNNISF